jgi:flotillin
MTDPYQQVMDRMRQEGDFRPPPLGGDYQQRQPGRRPPAKGEGGGSMIQMIIWLVVSIGLFVAPVALLGSDVGILHWICWAAGAFSLFAGGAVIIVTKLYIKTSANEAFYRTGAGKPKVIIDGGCLVVPVIHNLNRVLLETMKLEVVRLGPDALICKDFLRVDVSAEFYIRVNKNEGGVMAAATTLGRDATNVEAIKKRMMEKLVSALRTVAATMDLNELHQNREDFGARVQEAVTKDIEPNGFILETVTISQLDQTDVTNLKQSNVFDAQGLKKATEITQKQAVERNRIERDAELQITEKNVATRKLVLTQEQDRAFAEADQKAEVANREAQKDKEIVEYKISQEEEIEKRAVEKDRAVRASEIQRETALVDEAKKRETAEVSKEQAVDVANREKQIAIAEAEARRAIAEAAQRESEAKEREAAEKVTTAADVEIANREKKKAIIASERAGETKLIERQKAADADAYAMIKEAQAEKESAEADAAAKIRLAEAGLEAKRREAEGEQAIQMVPVAVYAKRVEVEAQKVEVLKQELKAKEDHQEAAIKLEIAKLQIDASEKVGMEMARSIGQFMSKGEFNIFGSPDTLAEMTGKFTDGLGVGQLLGGLKEGNGLLGGMVESGIQAATAGLEAAKAKAEDIATKPEEEPEKGKKDKT